MSISSQRLRFLGSSFMDAAARELSGPRFGDTVSGRRRLEVERMRLIAGESLRFVEVLLKLGLVASENAELDPGTASGFEKLRNTLVEVGRARRALR